MFLSPQDRPQVSLRKFLGKIRGNVLNICDKTEYHGYKELLDIKSRLILILIKNYLL